MGAGTIPGPARFLELLYRYIYNLSTGRVKLSMSGYRCALIDLKCQEGKFMNILTEINQSIFAITSILTIKHNKFTKKVYFYDNFVASVMVVYFL